MSCILLLLSILPALSIAADSPLPLELSASLPDGGQLRLLLIPGSVVGLVEGDNTSIKVFHQISNHSSPVTLRILSTDPRVVAVTEHSSFTLTTADSSPWPQFNASSVSSLRKFANSSEGNKVSLLGLFLGRASLLFVIENGTDGEWMPMNDTLKISVIRRLSWSDKVFTVLVICLIMVANLGMGTKLQLTVVKQVLRRPLAPAIGFVSQYTVMPLIAFAVGTLLKLPPSIRLGYFAAGCAPGGGASNIYTYLLRGDVSLSITMTLISTVAALGMVPLWLFTLGQYIIQNQEHKVEIPYHSIILSLFTMLVPVAIGYLIKRKLPRVAKVINKALKPFIGLLLVFFFTVGIYANLYIFKLISPVVIIAGCLLPYGGFIFGALIAFIFRLKPSFVRTVSIETGIQNSGVPIFLLRVSLPRPDYDISIVGPVAASVFMPIPLIIAVLGLEIYQRCIKKRREEKRGNETGSEENEADVDENATEVGKSLLEKEDERKEDDGMSEPPKEKGMEPLVIQEQNG